MLVMLMLLAELGPPQMGDMPQAKYSYEERIVITYGDYEVSLTASPFRSDRHRVSRNADGWIEIDGETRYGVGLSAPTKVLSGISMKVKSVPVPIDPSLWADCYALHLLLLSDGERDQAIKREAGGISVSVFGGDGASGYVLTLHLRDDGKHRREFFVP